MGVTDKASIKVLRILNNAILLFPLETIKLRLELDAATVGPNQYKTVADISRIPIEELYNGFVVVLIMSVITSIVNLVISSIATRIAGDGTSKVKSIVGNIMIPNIVLPLITYPLSTIGNRQRVNGTKGFKKMPLEQVAQLQLWKGLLAGRIRNAIINRLQPKILAKLNGETEPTQAVVHQVQDESEDDQVVEEHANDVSSDKKND
jgi:hypothetical protein